MLDSFDSKQAFVAGVTLVGVSAVYLGIGSSLSSIFSEEGSKKGVAALCVIAFAIVMSIYLLDTTAPKASPKDSSNDAQDDSAPAAPSFGR